MKSERKCLECSDLLHGRADQKFCGDQCRNAYNNRRAGETNVTIRRINRILKKNQSLLAGLNKDGKTMVPKSELTKKDFNFGYFTNLYTTHYGRTWYICYDQGYALANGEKVVLMKRKERAG